MPALLHTDGRRRPVYPLVAIVMIIHQHRVCSSVTPRSLLRTHTHTHTPHVPYTHTHTPRKHAHTHAHRTHARTHTHAHNICTYTLTRPPLFSLFLAFLSRSLSPPPPSLPARPFLAGPTDPVTGLPWCDPARGNVSAAGRFTNASCHTDACLSRMYPPLSLSLFLSLFLSLYSTPRVPTHISTLQFHTTAPPPPPPLPY
jgi:hypothetical protein